MTSKVLYLVPCLLIACCVTVSAIGNHFEDENSDSSSAGVVLRILTKSTSQ